MKTISIVGTRPQIIKYSVLKSEFCRQGVEDYLVYTGQHFDYEMSSTFFREFGLDMPDRGLVVGDRYGERIGQIIDGIIEIGEKFDCGVVFGDCDSTLAGALAVKKLGIPLVHIEAGLRCGDLGMIEERNRVIVDRISDMRFCPTDTAVRNLGREDLHGINAGNLLYDLFLETKGKLGEAEERGYTLVTFHREASLKNVLAIIEKVVGFGWVKFVCHPHTLKVIKENNIILPSSVEVFEPQGYLAMSELVRCASVVATDSGGLTQEAWMWGKKTVNLRGSTEWEETTYTDRNLSVYGDGKAAKKMVGYMRSKL